MHPLNYAICVAFVALSTAIEIPDQFRQSVLFIFAFRVRICDSNVSAAVEFPDMPPLPLFIVCGGDSRWVGGSRIPFLHFRRILSLRLHSDDVEIPR